MKTTARITRHDITKNDDRIRRLAGAVEALGMAYDSAVQAMYGYIDTAEAQPVRDLQIALRAEQRRLEQDRREAVDQWEGYEA